MKHQYVINNQSGLTLLHVMIGLLLFSFFFVPFVQMEKINGIQSQRDKETSRIEDIDALLSEYAARIGAYPAPANPTLPVNNVLHGASIDTTAAPPTGFPADCGPAPGTIINGVACLDGAKGAVAGVIPDIFVGALPLTELGLNLHDGLDPYGFKYTYIVTRQLVDMRAQLDRNNQIISNDNQGAILMENAEALGTPHAFVGGTLANLHFAVISHGENGAGAYTSNGVPSIPCPAAMGPERENCNGDGVVAAIEDAGSTNISDGLVKAVGAGFFDDAVRAKSTVFNADWVRVHNDNLVMAAGTNTSIKLGVGGSSTSLSLLVRGARTGANGGHAVSNKFSSQRLCSRSNETCFTTDTLTNPAANIGLKCDPRLGFIGVNKSGSSVNAAVKARCDTTTKIQGNLAAAPGGICLRGSIGLNPTTGELICRP